MTTTNFRTMVNAALAECDICLLSKDPSYNYGSVTARTRYGEVYEIARLIKKESNPDENQRRLLYDLDTEENAEFITVSGPRYCSGYIILISEVVEIAWNVNKAQRRF